MLQNNTNIETINVTVTKQQIKRDLQNGLTWLKKDDVGFGSIQETYKLNAAQTQLISSHPEFKDLKTIVRVITIVDEDTLETEEIIESNVTVEPTTPVLTKTIQTNTLSVDKSITQEKGGHTSSEAKTEALTAFEGL